MVFCPRCPRSQDWKIQKQTPHSLPFPPHTTLSMLPNCSSSSTRLPSFYMKSIHLCILHIFAFHTFHHRFLARYSYLHLLTLQKWKPHSAKQESHPASPRGGEEKNGNSIHFLLHSNSARFAMRNGHFCKTTRRHSPNWLSHSLSNWLPCSISKCLLCSVSYWLSHPLSNWLPCSVFSWLLCSVFSCLLCSSWAQIYTNGHGL